MADTVSMLRRRSSARTTVTDADPSANPNVLGPGKNKSEPAINCGDERSINNPITKHPHHAQRRDAFNETKAANTPAKLGDAPAIENTGMNAASMGNTIATAKKNTLHLMRTHDLCQNAREKFWSRYFQRECFQDAASWNCLGVDF
jgi:hypothetical protein